MSRAADYALVCVVASRTDPAKQYEVKRHLATGVVSCGCPAWKFAGGAPVERACKHLASIAAAGIILGLQPAAQARAVGKRAARPIVANEPRGAETTGAWRQILLDD